MKRAHKVMQLSCLPPLAEDASIVRTACTAVLSRFQTTQDPTGRVFASKLRSVCMPSSRTMCDHNFLPLAESVNAFWLGVSQVVVSIPFYALYKIRFSRAVAHYREAKA